MFTLLCIVLKSKLNNPLYSYVNIINPV
jgi:hypothetical protein